MKAPGMARFWGFAAQEASLSPRHRSGDAAFSTRFPPDKPEFLARFFCDSSAAVVTRQDSTIAFDGVIYNRAELGVKEETSDAEALLDLSRQTGLEQTLRAVDGDFAFALLDTRRAEIICCRDRFGVRPLYFSTETGGLIFGSTPLAVLDTSGAPVRVTREYSALIGGSHYRSFDNAWERSPFEGVSQVPPAHFLRWSPGGVKLERYWELNALDDHRGTDDELAEEYRELLLSSVRARLSRFSNPAFTLSGGMDSSSVLACANRVRGQRNHAFSCTYTDSTYDESAEIKTVVNELTETWTPFPGDVDDVLREIARLVEIHGEPVATATWLPHYHLCNSIAARGFDSLFGGLGGDELNAGEYEHFFFFFADLKRAGKEAELTEEIERWVAHHDHPIFRKSRKVVDDQLARSVDLTVPGKCLPDRTRMLRYAHLIKPELYDLQRFQPVLDIISPSYLKNRSFQDIFRETAPCCLRAQDRHASAASLPVINPFYDRKVVEFMFRIPGTLKIRLGVTKYLLRHAMQGLVPDAARLRVKKTGWNAPAHRWFTGSGASQFRELVTDRRFRERGIFDTAAVEKLIVEHEEIVLNNRVEENHMMALWQITNLELWFRFLEDKYSVRLGY